MRLSYGDWCAIRDRTEQELISLRSTGQEPDAKFSDRSFSWDYHYAYPPGSVRLHYTWKDGKVTGWRTSHWDEGPFAPEKITMDDKYLAKVFNVGRL